MVVRGQVLNQDEAGDARGVLDRGGLGQLLPVLHQSNLDRLVGQLNDNRRRLLILFGHVGTETAVDDCVGMGNVVDLLVLHGSS